MLDQLNQPVTNQKCNVSLILANDEMYQAINLIGGDFDKTKLCISEIVEVMVFNATFNIISVISW